MGISPLMKMWISFFGIFLLVVAITTISLSRYKFKGVLSKIFAVIAYISLILAAIIIFFIVFNPSPA